MRAAATAFAAFLPLLLIPSLAFAEIAMGESVEWLTMSRPHIAIVQVDATRGTGSKGHVTRILKGTPPADPIFRERSVEAGTELLVFFDASGTPDVTVDLSTPRKDYRAALGMDFSILDTREKILAAVEARVKRGGEGVKVQNIFQKEKGHVLLEVPFDSPAHGALYGGSTCYLAVPADPEVKTRLVEIIQSAEAGNGWKRSQATRKLSAFPGDETVTVLKSLLDDPAMEKVTISNGKTGHKQKEIQVPVVRQAAWDALKELGVAVPKPAGYRDDYSIRSF